MCLSPRCSRPFCDSAAPSQLRAAVRIPQLSALPSPNTKCNFCFSRRRCHICFCRVWLKVYLKKEVNIALLTRQRAPLVQDKQTKRLMISGPILLPRPERNTPRSRLAKHTSVLHTALPLQLESWVTFSMQSENGAFHWHPSVTAASHHLSACV